MSSKRLAFLDEALRKEGSPYVWCGDGPTYFDCSGLVCWCLLQVGGPDWRSKHNSHSLWNTLPETDAPRPGDLCFYGRPAHPTHVMIWWGDGRVYGACGGNSDVTSPELAQARGARVRFRQAVGYRPDFLGYRSLAPYLDTEE